MTNQNSSAELSSMIVGHTKFSPGRYFGLFKKAYRHSTVSTIWEIAEMSKASTTDMKIIPQLIKSPDGETHVKFDQWTSFLSQFLRTIPHILTYHIFKITDSTSGNVELKEYSNSTKSCSILRW